MAQQLDLGRLPNGTVLVMGVQYRGEHLADKARERIWDYVWFKTGGLWYGTGTGQVPQAAGWGAVERWLGKQDRCVAYVNLMTEVDRIYTAP